MPSTTPEDVRAELDSRAASGDLLPPCQLHYHLTEQLVSRIEHVESIIVGNGRVGLDETVRNTERTLLSRHRDHMLTRKWIYAIAIYVVVSDPMAIGNFIRFVLEGIT